MLPAQRTGERYCARPAQKTTLEVAGLSGLSFGCCRLSHLEMLLQHRQILHREGFHLWIAAALGLFLKFSNVFLVILHHVLHVGGIKRSAVHAA